MSAVVNSIKYRIINEYARYEYIFENMNEHEQRNYQCIKKDFLILTIGF